MQHLHILAKARAEDLEQENEELLAKLRHLQEQLCSVQVDRDCSWVDYREALVLNNQLTQVCLATSVAPPAPQHMLLNACRHAPSSGEYLLIHVS